MPILVPASTWHIPDGYTVPSQPLWSGNLSDGDIVTWALNSSQALPGSTAADWDIGMHNIDADTDLPTQSVTFGGTPHSGEFLIPAAAAWTVGISIGGGHVGDPGGTVFGLQLGAIYSTPGFSPTDATLILQLKNTLAPFGYATSVVTRGVAGLKTLDLELGVTALSWTIVGFPPQVPSSGGLPNYYFSNGFATPRGDWGAERSTRVSFSPQLMRLPSDTKHVDFFLAPLWVLDVTQLVPT